MKVPSICIAGKNKIAIDGLHLAMKYFSNEEICICPNAGDDGVSSWQPSLRRFASEYSIRTCTLDEVYQFDNILFLSLEFDRIVSPEKFRTNRLYNIHFSLLPAYKGMYTSAWPILNGEKFSGVTLHKIDKGIDTGNIIAQLPFEIGNSMTARDLYFQYLKNAKCLLSENFESLLSGTYRNYPQEAVGSTYYSKKSLNYSNLGLDLNCTAMMISRQVRAFSFREFQIPCIEGLPICDPQILANRSVRRPGTTSINDKHMVVCSVDFDILFNIDQSYIVFDMLRNDDPSQLNKVQAANILDQTDRNGRTPLIVASFQGKKDFCAALLEAGADVNKPNQNGTTPLMYAKSYGVSTNDFSIVQMLIRYGADIETKDCFGKTVVDYAIANNEVDALRFLGSRN